MQPYQVFLLVLYGISIVSIVLLLITTYAYRVRWHPVVSIILWMSIPYAVVALLHYPLNGILSERLPIPPRDRPLDQQHTGLAYFCAAEAILLYIFSAAGSGLTVSFALSLFAVVVKSSHPELATSPRTWRSFRWLWDASTTTLCVAPFVWVLPLVGASIEALVRTSRKRYPAIYYSNTFCNIDDRAYQAGIILGLPLIVAAILVLVILCMLVLMRLQNRGRATQLLNAPLAARFAAIVVQIFVTGIITICELALQDDQLRGTFRFHHYWTALTPLIAFCIFGTQRDLMGIWRYWAYRMVGREHTFTPRSSNEVQTLSNSSARCTTGANQHVIRTQDMYSGGSKAHKASSSAGRADSMSISDPLALMNSKRSHGPSEMSAHADADLESTLSESGSRRGRRGTTTAIPDLPYLPEMPHTTTVATPSPQQTQFYSTAGAVSSQGLVSSLGHSGARGLLAPQADLAPPTIVVTDGFGAVFGAQVPSSARGGMMGRPIITREERDRRLAAADNSRQRYPWAGSSRERERTRSTGLPPPPRSPRQSSARPLSAGGNATLERESLALPRPSTAGSAMPTSWDWDSPFRLAKNTSAAAQGARASDGGSGSHHGSDQGIELEEKIRTPSDGSFERGHSRKESHEKASSGPDPRDSWMSKESRMSAASDRTFG